MSRLTHQIALRASRIEKIRSVNATFGGWMLASMWKLLVQKIFFLCVTVFHVFHDSEFEVARKLVLISKMILQFCGLLLILRTVATAPFETFLRSIYPDWTYCCLLTL